MKTVGLVAPASRTEAVNQARRAAALLQELGARVVTEPELLPLLPGCDVLDARDRVDALVSLGGDGTLLRCAQYAAACDAPLLGINMGRLGFLAETEPEALEDALRLLLSGEYQTEERAMLAVRMPDGEDRIALNDVVITRGGYARLITMRVLVDGEEVGSYHADGLIVATPTGSTGYSLSAGGPIISPRVDCTVITPVCAHSLQHRPVVVPGSAVISVRLHSDDEMTASLQVDGQSCAMLQNGGAVDIRRAAHSVRLVRLKQERFFEVVHHKLIEWSC